MANECVLITMVDNPIGFAVANATGITKGTVLKISGSNTVAASNAVDDLIGGIAFADKIASDGVTQLAVYRNGRFKATISGSNVAVGDALGTSLTANMLKLANLNLSGSRIIGRALEPTSASGQTILFEMNIEQGANN